MKNDELIRLLRQFTLLSLIIMGLCIALLCSIAVKNNSEKRLGLGSERPLCIDFYYDLTHKAFKNDAFLL